MPLRYLLCLVGILLAILALTLIAIAFVTPVTISGGLYLLGISLVAVGLILAPWQPEAQFVLAWGGLAIILAVAGTRLNQVRNEAAQIKVILLPSGKGARLVDTLIDEQDSLLFGEKILRMIGGVSPHEHEGLVPAVTATYREANAANGIFPSPIVSTYLGLQKPAAFEAVVIEPASERLSPVGVIFLHGFAGNVSIQCWEIAQAVEKIGAITVCPSTGWVGDWWEPDGEAIVLATLDYLHDRGIQRIYLGGFSNGGHGLGSLVPALKVEQDLKGLFFIAGTRNKAGVRESGLPVLVIQGAHDERIPVEAARSFIAEAGERTTYIELEADHFLIIKQSQQVQDAIGTWLVKQEANR